MSDLDSIVGTDPHPDTLAFTPAPVAAPEEPPTPIHPLLAPVPAGIHPLDQSSPLVNGKIVTKDGPPGTGEGLGRQGERTVKPWNTENEDAFPVYQRAAHDWSANRYTLSQVTGEMPSPIQLAGRLRGCVSTVVWVPSSSALGVIISPDQGDIQQGAGVTLNPGDSIEISSEGPVWGGVIPGNTTGGPVQVTRYYNPPGGGLGLSSS
jgi:hypothetical protein